MNRASKITAGVLMVIIITLIAWWPMGCQKTEAPSQDVISEQLLSADDTERDEGPDSTESIDNVESKQRFRASITEYSRCSEWKGIRKGDTLLAFLYINSDYSKLDTSIVEVTKIAYRPNTIGDLIGGRVLDTDQFVSADEHYFHFINEDDCSPALWQAIEKAVLEGR